MAQIFYNIFIYIYFKFIIDILRTEKIKFIIDILKINSFLDDK